MIYPVGAMALPCPHAKTIRYGHARYAQSCLAPMQKPSDMDVHAMRNNVLVPLFVGQGRAIAPTVLMRLFVEIGGISPFIGRDALGKFIYDT